MKTKFIFIAILILWGQLLFSQILEKQSVNNWRSEYGLAFTGTGDLFGYCVYNEYVRVVSNKFKIAPAIGIMSFHRNDTENDNTNNLLRHADSRSLEFAGYFAPSISNSFGLEIGIGTFFRNWQWIYATGPNTSFPVSDNLHLNPSSYATKMNNSIGYSISIGFQTRITDLIGLSLRGVYQNDNNSDNSVSARLGMNIGF
jgi:hypothetical protein